MVGKLTRCLVAAAFSAFASAAVADADVTGSVHREPVDVSTHPWSAIGKLFNEAGGACTGAIIARDKVLTAAHCIFNTRTGRLLPPESLHFMVGYRRGEASMRARVAGYEVGSGYDPRRWLETMESDWVMLTLTERLPIEIEPLKLRRKPIPSGTKAIIAGYPEERAHLMTADLNCELGDGGGGGLVFHTCRGGRGYSGAPVLVISPNNEIEIAGIHVAMTRVVGGTKMIAVPVRTIARQKRMAWFGDEETAQDEEIQAHAPEPVLTPQARIDVAWTAFSPFAPAGAEVGNYNEALTVQRVFAPDQL